MKRPYVICHVLSSLDGRIDGDWFDMPQMKEIRPAGNKARDEYGCHAMVNGAITCEEIYADRFLKEGELPKAEVSYPREDCILDLGLKDYALCVDLNGTLAWSANSVKRAGRAEVQIIEVLGEDVRDEYIGYLQERKISYLFAGQNNSLNVETLLEKAGRLLKVDKIVVSGGGIIDWTFLKSGYLDELSLVVAPFTDGDRKMSAVFDRSSFIDDNEPVYFELLGIDQLPLGALRLRYRPSNVRD